ncbi:MAG TPA: HD domain-containing phosphohydrolase [Blastocatellia bacterium]|nr:HD domain-containing phosphohydrolase [Blastocatellia bacterium]
METAKGKTREEIINRLADRIDSFEKYTQPHSRLIAALATRLARRFGLAAPDIAAISEAAMLHDIGLWAMSPAYHPQPRPLSFEARLDLWRHPVIGEQQMVKRDAGRHAQLLVRWHHEWWNGSGYPDSLAFEDIPIAARIIRAVELYAALVADRPYRLAFSEKQAFEAVESSAGIECDPYVVKALLALLEELRDATSEQVGTEALNVPLAREPDASAGSAHVFEGTDRQAEPIQTGAPPAPEHEPASSSDNLLAQTPERSDDATQVSAPSLFEHREQQPSQQSVNETLAGDRGSPAPIQDHTPRIPPSLDLLLSRAQTADASVLDSRWRGWSGSRYNKKPLLGFQASVLRQIEFHSIAIPSWSEARLDWYLKTWGKVIYANDPRAWASTIARARVEPAEPLSEETIARVLHDVYVPGVKLANPDLGRWFGETDAWWMDNLRRNVEGLEDPRARAQGLTIGLHTGDYALSFNEETRELRRPLTTVFWRIAGRDLSGAAGHPQNRSFNLPVEEFIRQARADLLFLSVPSSHTDRAGPEARSEWRETWVTGSAENIKTAAPPQSKQSYLASIDRMLRSASNFRTWAIEYQEPGLASAQDIHDLIKEYRAVKATYSKDVTEVVGGLRSYIVVGERSTR